MRMKWTLLLLAAALLYARSAYAVEQEDGKVEEEEEVEVEKAAKEPFVASKFEEPKLSGEAHLWEYFRGRGAIGKSWLKSTAKKEGVDSEISKYNGEWEIGPPSEVSIIGDYALQVMTVARHHAIATRLPKPFTFEEDKPLVMQYEVRFEEGQTCGGGYVKLLSEGAEKTLDLFQDKTPYTIMFGPDKCSPSGKVHLIFRYRNPKNGTISEHHAKQPDSVSSTYWDDHKTHLYTLVVKPDGEFSVAVDYKTIISGNMLKDLVPPIEPPKEIADPEDKKPADWDDRAEVEDETATKPDDWDENAPKEIVDEAAVKPADWLDDEEPLIADPAAVKPDDWDTEMDGEWEPPLIDNEKCKGVSGCGTWKQPTKANPNYKGKWRKPKIANPAYKGVWSPRVVENPHYFAPAKPFEGLAPVTALGIELWTMSKNIQFDNLLITDSEEIAKEAAKLTFDVRRAEDARLREHKGEDLGIVKSLLAATETRPWLWAVYALTVLVPIIIIAVCCFGQKSGPTAQPARDTAAYRKKHDVATADDEAPLLVEAEEGEEEEEEEKGEEKEEEGQGEGDAAPAEAVRTRSSSSRSPARNAAAKKTARQKIEEDNVSTEEEEEEEKEEKVEEEKEEEAPKTTTAAKKRGRPKRAD